MIQVLIKTYFDTYFSIYQARTLPGAGAPVRDGAAGRRRGERDDELTTLDYSTGGNAGELLVGVYFLRVTHEFLVFMCSEVCIKHFPFGNKKKRKSVYVIYLTINKDYYPTE